VTLYSKKFATKTTRRERKAHRSRQRILDAARELFESHPYDDVKMDDISERVDLSRATLYNYFGSKEAIYFGIGIQGLMQMHERQRSAISRNGSGLDQILTLSGDALRYLFEQPIIHEIIRQYLVANAQADTPSHVVIAKMAAGEEVGDTYSVILASFLGEMREFEETWVEVIEKGYDDGSIRHELNPEQLTHFLFMIILGMIDRVNLEGIVLQQLELTNERVISLTVNLIRRSLETDGNQTSSQA
jgi:AcrR family transcriptional regulator